MNQHIAAVEQLLRKHRSDFHCGCSGVEAHLSPTQTQSDDECRDLLISVRDTLSSLLSISVEPCGTGPIITHKRASIEDALGACTILRLLLSSEVCPHAQAAFDYGGSEYREFVPHFLQLFALVRSEPESAAERLRPAVMETLGLMAELVHHDDSRETYLSLAHDVVSLLCDLHVVSALAGAAASQPQPQPRSIAAFERFGASHAAPVDAPTALHLVYELPNASPARSAARTLRLQTWSTALLLELHVRPGVQSLDGVALIRQRLWPVLCAQIAAWRLPSPRSGGSSSAAVARARRKLTMVTLRLARVVVARGSVSTSAAQQLKYVVLDAIGSSSESYASSHGVAEAVGEDVAHDLAALDDLAADCLQLLAEQRNRSGLRTELVRTSGSHLPLIAALRGAFEPTLGAGVSIRLQCALLNTVHCELRAVAEVEEPRRNRLALKTLLLAVPLLVSSLRDEREVRRGSRPYRVIAAIASVLAAALDAVPTMLRERVWQRRGVTHIDAPEFGDGMLPEKKRRRLSFSLRRVRMDERSVARAEAEVVEAQRVAAGAAVGSEPTLASALCHWTQSESNFLLGFDQLLACATGGGESSSGGATAAAAAASASAQLSPMTMDALLVALHVFNQLPGKGKAIPLLKAQEIRRLLLRQLLHAGRDVSLSMIHFESVVNGAIVVLHRNPDSSAFRSEMVDLMSRVLTHAVRGSARAPSRLSTQRARTLRFPEGRFFSIIDAANEIARERVGSAAEFGSTAQLAGLFSLSLRARCLVFVTIVAPELCWDALQRASRHTDESVRIFAVTCIPFAVAQQQRGRRLTSHDTKVGGGGPPDDVDMIDLTDDAAGSKESIAVRQGRELIFEIGRSSERLPIVRAAAAAAANAVAILACSARKELQPAQGRLDFAVPGLGLHESGDRYHDAAQKEGLPGLALVKWEALWTWTSRTQTASQPASPGKRSTQEIALIAQRNTARVFAAAAAANILRRTKLSSSEASAAIEFRMVRDFVDLLQDAHRPIRDVVARKIDLLVVHPDLVAAYETDGGPLVAADDGLGGVGGVPGLLKSIQESALSAHHVASVLTAIGTIGCASEMHDVLLRWGICTLIMQWTEVNAAMVLRHGRTRTRASTWHVHELRLIATVAVEELQRVARSKNHSVWALLAVHIPNIGAYVMDTLLTNIDIGQHGLVRSFHKDVLLDQLLVHEFWRNGGTVDLSAFIKSCMHVAVPHLVMQGGRQDQSIEKLCSLLNEVEDSSAGRESATLTAKELLNDMTPYVLHKIFTSHGDADMVQANAMSFLNRIGYDRPLLSKIVSDWFYEIMMLILWDAGGGEIEQSRAELAFGVVANVLAGTHRLEANIGGDFASSRSRLLERYFLFFLVVIDRSLDDKKLRAWSDIAGHDDAMFAGLRVASAFNKQFCISADKRHHHVIVALLDGIEVAGVQAIFCLRWLIGQLPRVELKRGADTHVHKIMSTLKTALRNPALASAACDAWDTLVRALSNDALYTNLSAIVAELFTYAEGCYGSESQTQPPPADVRARVLEVLRYLLIEKSDVLSENFEKIPSIPVGCEYDDIRASVLTAADMDTAETRIPKLVELSTEDSPTVRQLALVELLRMLEENASILHDLARKGDVNIISTTMRSLLKRCKTETDPTATLLLAKCLGQLGAIDPAHLQVSIQPSKDSLEELSALDLAVELLRNNLIVVHRSASVAVDQDRVSFAFQQLLSFLRDHFDSSEEAFPDTIKRLFRSHPEELELVFPYLATNYEIVSGTGSGAKMVHPLYGQSIVSDHKEWMAALSRKVCDAAQEARGDLKSVFLACRGVFRASTELAQFLLPYMVKAVLSESPDETRAEQRQMQDARDGIKKEVLAVLQDKAQRRKVDESMALLCTQSVFSLLDTLKMWGGSGESSDDDGDGDGDDVATPLLGEISERVLANAAFRCKAYARALLHLETDLQSTPRPARNAGHAKCWLVEKDLAYLQRIYAHLDKDDPDALAGIATLRLRVQRAVTLKERIIDYEAAEQWSNALASYEQLLLRHHSSPADGYALAAAPSAHSPDSLNEVELHQGTLRCMKQLGHLETVIRHVNGIASNNEDALASHLVPYAVEAAWRLGQWGELETLLEQVPYHGGSIGRHDMWVGAALLGLQRLNPLQVRSSVEAAQREIMAPLAAATSESYSRAYPLLLQLHQLREIEHATKLIDAQQRQQARITAPPVANPMMDFSPDVRVDIRNHGLSATMRQFRWDERLGLTATSYHHRVHLIVLRRAIASIFNLRDEQAELWKQLATSARTAGNFVESSRAIMHLDELGRYRVARMERAKNLHAQGHIHSALVELEPVEPEIQAYIRAASTQDKPSRRDLANDFLIATMWMQEAGLKHGEGLIDRFKAVKQLQPDWDQAHFQLGHYYDYMLRDLEKKISPHERTLDEDELTSEEQSKQYQQRRFLYNMLIAVLESYGNALMYGHTYLFEAMPRLLTLWFTYGHTTGLRLQAPKRKGGTRGARAARDGAAAAQRLRRRSKVADSAVQLEETTFDKINEIIMDLHQQLPDYQFLTALPQLMSRVCHPSPTICNILKNIVARTLNTYPQQAMWSIIGLVKSKITERRHAARDIVGRVEDPPANELLNSAIKTFDELIAVAKKKPKNNKKKMTINVRPNRHISRGGREDAIGIIVPTQLALTVTLPRNNGETGRVQGDKYAHVFGGSSGPVVIRRVESDAMVMKSKEKPKRIALVGEDGKTYYFLCKQENERKGDLRKDARMMEINTVVNRLLQHDDGGRTRQLRLRTYAVMCLSETCGLMEWVDNTATARSLIEGVDKKLGLASFSKRMQLIKHLYEELQADKESDLKDLAEKYEKDILQDFPPSFHRWFIEHFPDPSAWFEARLTYSRSVATWSMVGHIVGLGDRHCENILIDTKNGECVHVDFDCLFDKGLTFSVPEMVPFRLTPNIVDAMGVCGVEGAFRRVCQTTMSVLRRESEMLMNVLDAFVHDPLVEWGGGCVLLCF